MGKLVLQKGSTGLKISEASSGTGLEIHSNSDLNLSGKVTLKKPLGSIVRHAADTDLTVPEGTQLLVLAVDVTGARTITLPAAKQGAQLKAVFEVAQTVNAGSFVFLRAGSDNMFGSIAVKDTPADPADGAGDGNVEVGALTSVRVTTGVANGDTKIGSYIEFQCIRDGMWFVSGIVSTSDEDGTVAFS